MNKFSYESVEKEYVECNLCGSEDFSQVHVGDRYGMGIVTVICNKCSLFFTNPRPKEEIFKEFYAKHYRKFYEFAKTPSLDYIQKHNFTTRANITFSYLEKYILNNFPQKDCLKVLDIGCSEGSILRTIQDRSTKNIEAYGIEPSKKFSEFASKYSGAKIFTGTLNQFCEHYGLLPQFDFIILNHVLEHFLDPLGQLKIVNKLLNSNGLVFIEVPNILGNWSGINMLHIAHIYHFHEVVLQNMLAKAGFSPVEISKEGNYIHPWAMFFVCKKDPIAKVSFPDTKLIRRSFREVKLKIKSEHMQDKRKYFAKLLSNLSQYFK